MRNNDWPDRELGRLSSLASTTSNPRSLREATGAGRHADDVKAHDDLLAHVVVATSSGLLVLDPGEITWIAAHDYYAEVNARGRRFLLRESVESLAVRLEPSGFVHVHRSACVNLAHVREIVSSGDNTLVVLRDGTRVPVSRRRRALLLAVIRREFRSRR